MLHRLLSLIILFLLTQQSQAQFDKQNRSDFSLRDNVKQLKVVGAKSANAIDKAPWEVYFFNKNGLIDKVDFYQDGAQAGTGIYEFTSRGLIKSIKAINPDGSDMGIILEQEFENNLPVKLIKHMSGEEERYVYNDAGQKKEEQHLAAGKVRSSFNYEYDDKGNVVRKLRLLPDGSVGYEFRYEYDTKGNIVKQEGYYQDKFNDGWLFKYDKKGNKIEAFHQGEDRMVYDKFYYDYDKNGNLLNETNLDGEGKKKSEVVYTYNKYGDLVDEKKYGVDGQLVIHNTVSYEYDNKRNWLVKTQKQSGEIIYLTKREISYY